MKRYSEKPEVYPYMFSDDLLISYINGEKKMDKQLFSHIVYDLEENIEKQNIGKSYHLDYDSMTLRDLAPWAESKNDLLCAESSVRSQILGLYNQGLNCNLSNTLKKLNGDLGTQTDPVDKEVYFPKQIADDLLRYAELNRTKPIFALKHKKTRFVYGSVSDRHQILQDSRMYEMYEAIFSDIPHTVSFEHNYFRCRININLDDIRVDLGKENSMSFRISLGNSMFGMGSAFVRAGTWEQICSNGAMGWKSRLNKVYNLDIKDNLFDWKRSHVYAPINILKDMQDGLIKQLTYGDKYMEAVEDAYETTESIFKKEETIEKELTDDRFKLTKNEALQAYRLLKHKHEQYQNTNAFDTGRVIAEVARDTISLDRKIELEKIAGQIMFSQIN